MVRTLKWARASRPKFYSGTTDYLTKVEWCEKSSSMDDQAASSSSAIQAANEAAEGAEKAAKSAMRAADAADRRAWRAANAADRAAESAEVASELLKRATDGPVSSSGQKASTVPTNPWNRFQWLNANKGWSKDRMRAEHLRARARVARCLEPRSFDLFHIASLSRPAISRSAGLWPAGRPAAGEIAGRVARAVLFQPPWFRISERGSLWRRAIKDETVRTL